MDQLTQINKKKNAKEISIHDFRSLYTMLQHEDLIHNLNQIVDFAFSGGNLRKMATENILLSQNCPHFGQGRKKEITALENNK